MYDEVALAQANHWQVHRTYNNFIVYTNNSLKGVYKVHPRNDPQLSDPTVKGTYITLSNADICCDHDFSYLHYVLENIDAWRLPPYLTSSIDILYKLFPEYKKLLEQHILAYSKHLLKQH